MKTYLVVLSLLLSSNSFANIVGTNIQNFNPTTSGISFVTVQSPETLKPKYVNFGFFLNYAGNSLPQFENDDGERLDADDRLLYADFNLGFGIMKNLDFGLSFPVVLDQTIDEETQNVLFAENGLTEIRANLKYMFTKIKDWKGAFVLSVNHNLIGNNPYTGEGAGNTVNTEFTFGTKINDYNFAVNAGYRFRNAGTEIEDSVIQPLEDQWIASAGLSKKLRGSDLSLIFEFLTSIPTEVNGNTKPEELSSYEALVGVKYDNSRTVASHAGLGFGLVENTASPDWRVYAGVNWTFGPLWKGSKSKKKYRPIKHTHSHSHQKADGTIVTHSHKHSHFKKTSHSKKALSDHDHSRPDSFEDHAVVGLKPVKHSHRHSHVRGDGTVVTHSHGHTHLKSSTHDKNGLNDHLHSDPNSFSNHYEQPEIKKVNQYRLENLNFKSGSHKFNKKIGVDLRKFLVFLKKKKSTILKLVIEGHTDSTGDRYMNESLSFRRAEELKRLVIKFTGIDGSIIDVVGRGQTQPIATNNTPQGRRENRRVEVYVSE